MDFGFSSAARLRRGWQFDLVFRTGRRETGALVRLFFVKQPDSSTLVGVTVGKKIAKACKRTRGRRMLRESFRRLLPWMKNDVWIVASLRECALDLSAREVYEDMARCLKRRGLMRDDWPGSDWAIDCSAER